MNESNMVAIDAHAHLYSCFEVGSFLECTFSNLSEAGSRDSCGVQPACVLFVLSMPGVDGFGRLRSALEQGTHDSDLGDENWQVHGTAERVSVCMAVRDRSLVAIAGRQVNSRERLEVLALGTRQQFEEGQPARTLIQEVAQAGAIPVLPWGVGKWLGRRGQLVEELIEDPDLPPFFLGDSAHRPTFWPQPSQFRRAEEQGIKNLSGSDPLPFPREVQRAGSFGVVLDESLNLERPAQDLKQKLLDPSTTFRQFGEGEALARFVRNQLKMQFRKFTQ
jgi:hypothetical protein